MVEKEPADVDKLINEFANLSSELRLGVSRLEERVTPSRPPFGKGRVA